MVQIFLVLLAVVGLERFVAVAWIAFGCGILQFGKRGWVLVDCVEVRKSRGIVVGLGMGFLDGPVDCRRSIGVGLAVLFVFFGRSMRRGRFWVFVSLSLV